MKRACTFMVLLCCLGRQVDSNSGKCSGRNPYYPALPVQAEREAVLLLGHGADCQLPLSGDPQRSSARGQQRGVRPTQWHRLEQHSCIEFKLGLRTFSIGRFFFLTVVNIYLYDRGFSRRWWINWVSLQVNGFDRSWGYSLQLSNLSQCINAALSPSWPVNANEIQLIQVQVTHTAVIHCSVTFVEYSEQFKESTTS